MFPVSKVRQDIIQIGKIHSCFLIWLNEFYLLTMVVLMTLISLNVKCARVGGSAFLTWVLVHEGSTWLTKKRPKTAFLPGKLSQAYINGPLYSKKHEQSSGSDLKSSELLLPILFTPLIYTPLVLLPFGAIPKVGRTTGKNIWKTKNESFWKRNDNNNLKR